VIRIPQAPEERCLNLSTAAGSRFMSACVNASRENVSTLRTSSDDEKPKLDDFPGMI